MPEPKATWPRPVPLIGDSTSAAERAADPGGWAFDIDSQRALADIIGGRRDIRRYRPDALDPALVRQVLAAGHNAPSVGHSQPWRFIVVGAEDTREHAAMLADRARHRQASMLDDAAGQHLLDLQLDGIREAPIGIVMCCDRRVASAEILGRATFEDADLWSCACAIQNMWLTARSVGFGMGWVTLFEPDDLAQLVGLPEGVASLGWLCLGYPDERPPEPGLMRAGWSARVPLESVTFAERWPDTGVAAPIGRIAGLKRDRVVAAHDDADSVLAPPGSLGRLDQVADRIIACGAGSVTTATLVLVGGDHLVADLGVTAYRRSVTADVIAAAHAGTSLGVTSARVAGFDTVVIDAGVSSGDLLATDALTLRRVAELVTEGQVVGRSLAPTKLVLLGEVGIGNTTVAAALACALLPADPVDIVGLGAAADTEMMARKREVVTGALARYRSRPAGEAPPYITALAALGGPEIAFLTGVVLGTAEAGGVVVLDGMVTSVAALLACDHAPAVSTHLVAGQRSRELGHLRILQHLGLSPLLDLRLRAGEGVGAVLAARMVLDTLATRREVARVSPAPSDETAVKDRPRAPLSVAKSTI